MLAEGSQDSQALSGVVHCLVSQVDPVVLLCTGSWVAAVMTGLGHMQAWQAFHKLGQLKPEDPDVPKHLARLHHRLGEPEAAIQVTRARQSAAFTAQCRLLLYSVQMCAAEVRGRGLLLPPY